MAFLARKLLPKSPQLIRLSCIEDEATNDKCCEDHDDNRRDGAIFFHSIRVLLMVILFLTGGLGCWKSCFIKSPELAQLFVRVYVCSAFD